MWRGEMLATRWRDASMGRRMVYLPQTKNGTPRTVPLPDEAFDILDMRYLHLRPLELARKLRGLRPVIH